MRSPIARVACPECGEQIIVEVDLSAFVTIDGSLTFSVDPDVQPIWDHAAKHVWDQAGGET